MYATSKAMQNKCSTSASFAEAGEFACAFFLLGTAIAAESIFVVIFGILAVLLRIIGK